MAFSHRKIRSYVYSEVTMDKRYQVFVSSTYIDLKDERQRVIQALMEMDCIPAGMELFPATDEEQWSFIQKVIDDCDYYLLIIGGRYGSTAQDGISYTEKEFDYAVSKGIKVIALLHEDPDMLPKAKSEISESQLEKLQAFRNKVSDGRLVKYWREAAQLPGEVALSLNKTIKMFPAIGWVRANSTASPELLAEINELRKCNDALRLEVDSHHSTKFLIDKDELADMDSIIHLTGTYELYAKSFHDDTQYRSWSADISWRKLFATISPCLADNPTNNYVNGFVAESFCGVDTRNIHMSGLCVDEQVLYTIRIQFLALELIAIVTVNQIIKWELTDLGLQTMLKLRVIKS